MTIYAFGFDQPTDSFTSVWKPIRGPIESWPLALCEPSSLQEGDLEPCDLVYPDYVVENRQIYHSDKHKWFYLSAQRDDEAWVFLQTDSARSDWTGKLAPTTTPCRPVVLPVRLRARHHELTDHQTVAHTSFPISGAQADAAPRESIEVRALVYYDDTSV